MVKKRIWKLVWNMGYSVERRRDPITEQRQLCGSTADGRPVVFDVGAHHGETARRYRGAFPDATIYSFEPSPESFQELSAAVAGDSQTFPQRLALGERVGECAFHINDQSPTNSIFAFDERAAHASTYGQAKVIRVPMSTVDAFCLEQQISRIDVLKLDVQGAEVLALRGAARMLREGRIGLIYSEVIFIPYYKGGATYHELAGLLSEHGYGLYRFYTTRYDPNGQLKWADALFIRRP